jgi:hypothetical protein
MKNGWKLGDEMEAVGLGRGRGATNVTSPSSEYLR